MKKKSILSFVIALITVLSMTMVGKVNVEAKSPTYWYYSYFNNTKYTNKHYFKWNKNTLSVYSPYVKVKTTNSEKAKMYAQLHQNKYKVIKKTFRISPKVKLQEYESGPTEKGKFYKGKKKEMLTWEKVRFSFKVQGGVVTGICVCCDEYLGE